MTTTIVVGIDGSGHARAALRWALREARLRGCDVLALHAYHSPLPGIGIGVAGGYVDLRDPAVAILDDEVGKALAEDGSDVHVRRRVIEGDAATALVRAAGADDLVVVGSRGHGVVAGALLGSTSRYVACHAHCSVVVVRGGCP
jgi:nucleotide-binding universal stress UspA family protein